jgi:hypothetical protein
VTDLAQALATVIEEVAPRAFHNTEQYANNTVECGHGRLQVRLRPMRGLKTDRTAQIVIAGHAFMQNLLRGHYELGVEADPRLRVGLRGNPIRRNGHDVHLGPRLGRSCQRRSHPDDHHEHNDRDERLAGLRAAGLRRFSTDPERTN